MKKQIKCRLHGICGICVKYGIGRKCGIYGIYGLDWYFDVP